MRLLHTIALCAVFIAASGEEDRLRQAILLKSAEQLKDICSKANIPLPEEDPPIYTLRALVYEFGQRERPGNMPIKPWSSGDGDGASPAGKAKSASTPKAAPGAAQSSSKMAAQFFSKMDKDDDGRLSPAELQPIIDQTNAKAKAMGEPEQANMFKQLDADADGFVSQSESEAFFAKFMGGTPSPKAGASSSSSSSSRPGGSAGNPLSRDPDGLAKAMFKNLDKDQNGRLSREEFKTVLEKTAEQSKASGEEVTDWFAELDKDKDEGIDSKEVLEFFRMMEQGGLFKKDEL